MKFVIKKLSIALLAIISILCTCLAFAACGSGKEVDNYEISEENTEVVSGQDNAEEEVAVYLTNFSVLYTTETESRGGAINESALAEEKNCGLQSCYIVIDFDMYMTADNIGNNETLAMLLTFGNSEVVDATVSYSNTSCTYESAENDTITIEAVYTLPEKAYDTKNVRLEIKIDPKSEGTTDINYSFAADEKQVSGYSEYEIFATISDEAMTVSHLSFEYTLNSNGKSYAVTGLGSAGGTACVRDTYNGLPVTAIGEAAFKNEKSLTCITIPESVTSIGDSAFYGCNSLASITIPDSVTSIGDSAFYGCTSLVEFIVPDGVTSIGSSAFGRCTSLASIQLPFVGYSAKAASASEYTLFGYIFGTSTLSGDVEVKQYYSESGYETYYIPSSLTAVTITTGNIFYGAFYNCSMLASIVLGEEISSIGAYAFYGCKALTEINIPESVTAVCEYSFYNCFALQSVTMGNEIRTFGNKAFYGCNSLTTITIPDSVQAVGDSCFESCTSLESITFGNNITEIGNWAFYFCKALKEIIIPDSVIKMGYDAFSYCTSLNSVIIGEGITVVSYCAFYGCTALESITIPDNVKSIGSFAFSECTSLKSIVIGSGVTYIYSDAFYHCNALTSAIFKNTEGWYVSYGKKVTVTDENTSAGYLKGTYFYYNWYRSDN